MNIKMKPEKCYICHGSGYYTPYPYRKQKKCDHIYDKGTIVRELNDLKKDRAQIVRDIERLEDVLETSEEV